MVLMTLAWLSVSLVLVSDPQDEDLIPALLGVVYSLVLILAWLGLCVAAAQIAFASNWPVLKRVAWVLGYWRLFLVAAWLFFYPLGEENLPLRARFGLSEAALDRAVVERPEGSFRAGLFRVSKIQDVQSCVFLETGGSVLADGFAYCPAGYPAGLSRGSPPDIVMYPMNEDWETSSWWSYNVVVGEFDADR